jgi:hypothetical protein
MVYTQEMGRAFWYEFDRRTLYDDVGFWPIANAAEAGDVQSVWRDFRRQGNYPADFAAWAQERAGPWGQLAALQRAIVEAHFGAEPESLGRAFEDFGQGVISDPAQERAARNDSIHMMDGQTAAQVIGYHRWHASIRAIQMSGAGDAWWEELARWVGCAWAIQSLARPRQRRHPAPPNPPIDRNLIDQARNAWLVLTPDQLDRQYERTPGVTGYHPDPLHPV